MPYLWLVQKTLADVSWQEAAVDPTDGYDIPIRYTAVASYTGTATSKYATGYTVTADYKGDVTRTSCDTVVYTAVFSSVGAAASAKSGVDFNWLWLLIPVGAAALGGCGYAGYKGYKHYINKKEGTPHEKISDYAAGRLLYAGGFFHACIGTGVSL